MSDPSPSRPFDFVKSNVLTAQGSGALWQRENSIDGRRWNKLYPYQFIVVERTATGYTPKTGAGWTYTLPIPPEAMSLTVPFAINPTLTLGGVVEEHSGQRTVMISLSGTTGVFFGRSEAQGVQPISFLQSVFSGTIAAAQDTARSIKEFDNGVGTSFQVNVVDDADFAEGGAAREFTGYYQFRLLQSYLESYAELKRTPEGNRAHLAFAMWKDEAIYLVAPLQFSVRKTAASPLEYIYNIELKGTKRVALNGGGTEPFFRHAPAVRKPNVLAQALQTIEEARAILQDAKQTIAAIGGDLNHAIFEPLREMCLFIKDGLAIPLAVSDLADSVIQDARNTIVDALSTSLAMGSARDNIARKFGQLDDSAMDALNSIKALSGERKDEHQVGPNASARARARASQAASPANKAFSDPAGNFRLFRRMPVGALNLSPTTIGAIQKERERVRRLTRTSFEVKQKSLEKALDDYATALGVGAVAYDRVLGITRAQAPVTATDDDFEAMGALNRCIVEMSRLAVTLPDQRETGLEPIEYIAGLARAASIPFTVPVSKFAVPFPYGSTLEGLARQYLKDPGRWMEIATLNGLRAPYVDEVGIDLALLVNGAGNSVMVSSDAMLYIGQPAWIESVAVQRTRRRITRIEKMLSGQFLVYLDGDPDLDRYATLASAKMHVFTPDTTNSMQLIYVPSTEATRDQDFKAKSLVGVNEYEEFINVGGIDLLLTPKGDLVITPDGDTRWAVGLVNITQKVRLATSVRRGTLFDHPDYGLPLEVGQSVADLDALSTVKAVRDLFKDDPTFVAVKAARVELRGSAIDLGLAVEIAGSSRVIPISTEIKQHLT